MDERAHTELTSIIEGLSSEDRAFIAAIPESEIIQLHHTLGMYVRNQFRSNRLPALSRWSVAQLPTRPHLDDVSWLVLVEIWKALRPTGAANT